MLTLCQLSKHSDYVSKASSGLGIYMGQCCKCWILLRSGGKEFVATSLQAGLAYLLRAKRMWTLL